ncbi:MULTISPECIES: hypothetical protein [unclassified Minwuia]|uniref:hypothetical protein n=1 Tax=unclassified Minwuia TaxID=2618799 RepID=UPI0024794FC8|nr:MULTISPECIES: hypothetical protein [unclassified Minwuia]
MGELVFFHTADSNVDLFETAARTAGLPGARRHVVRPALLESARIAGGLNETIRSNAASQMVESLEGADRLICTCSTLGPVADTLAGMGRPVIRVDRALAEAAVTRGPRIAALVTLNSTIEPTRDLFQSVAGKLDRHIRLDLIIVEGAAQLLADGDITGYARAIANAVDATPDEYDAIALAQASMAPAAQLAQRPVMTSPATAMRALAAELDA